MTVSRREFVAIALAGPLTARVSLRARAEHVVVVGAGAFGGWSALALRRAGLQVTLIDAWGAGHSRASSGGETRVIRAVYGGVAAYTAMAARAFALWREAERQWQRQVLYRTGSLWLCADDDGYVQRSIAPMRAAGLTLERLSPADAERRFPQIRVRDARAVYVEPEAGFLTARVACELVREAFVREGGTYRDGWARPGAVAGKRLTSVVLADGTRIDADRIVFACGPWMSQVFPEAVGRRIVATRQEVFWFGTPPGDRRYDPTSLPVWVHLGDRITYGVPNHDRRGIKIADDSAGAEVHPTTMDRVPTAAGLARARAILAERFPALRGAPVVESRVCQYEASTDGNFLIDRHPGLDNVWLVGGGSGHGFKMGPALGEHVAQLVTEKATVNPLFAYRERRMRPVRR